MVSFLRALVDLTLVKKQRVCIDFRNTVKCYSDGTLLFYAELQRILARRPNTITCKAPRNRVAGQVLCHLGILKQLGYTKDIPSERDDVTHWQRFAGRYADATQGVGQAIDDLQGLGREQIRYLFRSVSEALTNVTQHAYIEQRMDGSGHPSDAGWWMFVREEPDELQVCFCDLGVGVPYSVPRNSKHSTWFSTRMGSVLQAFGIHSHRDAETIQVTVDEKRSRFELTHRGNGFGNMLESVAKAESGRLIINSNRGAYMYSSAAGKATHLTRNYEDSIFGTVVAWSIKLPKGEA
jgi:hypothetical protein